MSEADTYLKVVSALYTYKPTYHLHNLAIVYEIGAINEITMNVKSSTKWCTRQACCKWQKSDLVKLP